MASVRGMTPEATLALIKRELANVKLSEGQIRDLIQTNTGIVKSIVNLEEQVEAGLTGEALDQLEIELKQLKTELQTQAETLVKADTTLQENAQTLIDNAVEMALLSALLSDDGFLNTEKIKPESLTGEHLAARTVAALNIAAGAIVSEKIATDAITSNHIVSGAIVSKKIATDAITSNHIVSGAIVSEKIAANAVTTNELAANAVTTNELAVGAVKAKNISAEGISADLITAGSLSATRVELDGDDLATQMQFILTQLDANFNALLVRFDGLEEHVEDRVRRPVFSATYGLLDMPNNAYDPFMAWVNQSQETYSSDGDLATLALRVEKFETPAPNWYISFPETFEGRVQIYRDGAFMNEFIHKLGSTQGYSLNNSNITRLVWFAEAQTPYVNRWRQVFNEGGQRVRVPSGNYGYLSPYKTTFYSSVSDEAIDYTFRMLGRDDTIARSTSHIGTAGGSSYLVARSTDGTQTTTQYPSLPGDPSTWYPMHLTGHVESASRSIFIQARIRIRQPKRADRYGFVIYKNRDYLGFVVGTGVGSLTGASPLFSHEDVRLNKNMEVLLYPGDTITIIPVIMIIGAQPMADPDFMEIDWELQIRPR